MDNLIDDVLYLIYFNLPPINRVLFALAYRRIYFLMPIETRDIDHLIRERCGPLMHFVNNGGVLVGRILLECLFGVNTPINPIILFDSERANKHHNLRYGEENSILYSSLIAKNINMFYKLVINVGYEINLIPKYAEINKESSGHVITFYCRKPVEYYVATHAFPTCQLIYDGKLKLIQPSLIMKSTSIPNTSTFEVFRRRRSRVGSRNRMVAHLLFSPATSDGVTKYGNEVLSHL